MLPVVSISGQKPSREFCLPAIQGFIWDRQVAASSYYPSDVSMTSSASRDYRQSTDTYNSYGLGQNNNNNSHHHHHYHLSSSSSSVLAAAVSSLPYYCKTAE